MNKKKQRKTFSPEQVKEAKVYYINEALKKPHRNNRKQALLITNYFDEYPDIKGEPSNSMQYIVRIEGMLERYFKLKEKGAL